MANNRAQWSGQLGFLIALIGSAAGLGNIWGFPHRMASSGGFAFLLVYAALSLTLGYVLVLMEMIIGRKSAQGALCAFSALVPERKYKVLGGFAYIGGVLCASFYVVLGGYCLRYALVNFASIFGIGPGSMGATGEKLFLWMLHDQIGSMIFTALFVLLNYVIITGGVRDGIERFSRWAMSAIIVMLGIIIARSLTLPGASDAISFMFRPDFKPLTEDFFGILSITACQIFLSLSIGMGTTLTYSSYLSSKVDLEYSALTVVIADTVFSVLAGLAVIPAAMAIGGAEALTSGPKLLFNTLQEVFLRMGTFGPIFGSIFYCFVVIVALTSSVSFFEMIASSHLDRAQGKKRQLDRNKICRFGCILIFVLSIVITLDGLGENNIYNPVKDFFGAQPWNDSWIALFEAATEAFLFPIGSFFACLFVGYKLTKESVIDEVCLCGKPFRTQRFFFIMMRVAAPILIGVIFFSTLKSYGLI